MLSKLYPCKKCGRLVLIRSKGLCPACRAKEMPNKTVQRKKREGLSDFYKEMLEVLESSRMSYTGKPIHSPTVCNVCHILPKRIYKSVAQDRDNIIFLTDEEHTKFDRCLDCLEFKKLESDTPIVWRRVLQQIKKMLDDGKIQERGRLINAIEETYFNC